MDISSFFINRIEEIIENNKSLGVGAIITVSPPHLTPPHFLFIN
jgi:hypothetical protein